jgi:hypothetical protein
VVVHRPRVGARVPEDCSIGRHDRHPRVDAGAQPLDERVDDLCSIPGFQRRRNDRRRHLCLRRKLLGQPIDVELAPGDREVNPEHHQHGNDEADLGQSETGTDRSGYQCRKNADATSIPATRTRGRGRGSRRSGRSSGHSPQYRWAVSPSRDPDRMI